jgi:hypothetical protein
MAERARYQEWTVCRSSTPAEVTLDRDFLAIRRGLDVVGGEQLGRDRRRFRRFHLQGGGELLPLVLLGRLHLVGNVVGRALGQFIEEVVEIIEPVDLLVAVRCRKERHEDGEEHREERGEQQVSACFQLCWSRHDQ